MKPIYLSIQRKATGERIRELLLNNGYTVKDIQEVMGFENPQAVYKWLCGKSLPNLDNLLILSKVLHTSGKKDAGFESWDDREWEII